MFIKILAKACKINKMLNPIIKNFPYCSLIFFALIINFSEVKIIAKNNIPVDSIPVFPNR